MRTISCVIVMLLAGCSSVPGRLVPWVPDAADVVALPRPVELVAGESLDCGAETLHAVLHYHGASASLEALAAELHVPGVAGTLPQTLIQVARQHGFETRMVNGSSATLQDAIDRGVPPIILARLGRQSNHYLIPTGYSASEGWFLCEFYNGKKWLLSAEDLQEVWRPCGFLQLEITPEAAASDLVRARKQEEHGNLAEALELYRQVLAENPDRTEAHLGAGNCLALQGAHAEARQHYLVAREAGSCDPELLNNLADVSLALGDHGDLARSWAEAAVQGYEEQWDREGAGLPRAVLARKLALALGTLAAIHFAREEFAAAREGFQRSLQLLPPTDHELRKRRRQQLADCSERLADEVDTTQVRWGER